MSIVGPIAVFGSWGDAMLNLICRCPKTQQPIDLQLYTDSVSLALIWSNPVRFQCPHCGTDHETKVGAAHLEPLSRRSSSDHLSL
jgi:hypothetical protein